MRRVRNVTGKISGTVYCDTNFNGVKDKEEMGLQGVRILLYLSSAMISGNTKGKSGDVEVLKEKMVGEAVTDDKGEYSFDIQEGRYSLKLDIDTLPAGKGVLDQNLKVEKPEEIKDFIIRDVGSIRFEDRKRQLVLGESIHAGPVVRDRDGNRLAAAILYQSDQNIYDFGKNQLTRGLSGKTNRRVLIRASAGNVAEKLEVEFRMPRLDTVEKVKLAYHAGLMDQSGKMLNLSYALFDRGKLPGEYRSDMPVKSATTVLNELWRYTQQRDAESSVVEAVSRYGTLSSPKLDKEYISPSGYFRIHYTTKGSHAVGVSGADNKGIPGYIRQVGEAFDLVRNQTCTVRGFRSPVVAKDKKYFEIYVYDLNGKYGVTVSDSYYKDSGSSRRTASCYISIDNTYAASKGFKKDRDDCMKVTAAHEFFHAVQYAYNVEADTWWMEASATWNEDEIYDGVNDYIRYLEGFFTAPEKSLEKNSYGGVAFAKHISEHWGGYSTIRRIWEIQTATSTSIEAIERAIREKYRNENLGTLYDLFSAYNFNPSQYYREGSLWTVPVAFQNVHTGFPVKSRESQLNHLAANYQLFKDFAPGNNTLRILIDGEDKINWGFKVQKRRKDDGSCEVSEVVLDNPENRAEILCRNCGDTYSEICLIPANLEKLKDRARYTYEANLE